jgi:integrase
LKQVEQVAGIKELLAERPRDLALFTLGINSALRGGDLVGLQRDDVEEVDGRLVLHVLERKTRKPRVVPLNQPTSDVLRRHLETSCGKYVFEGQRGRLSVSYLGRLVKGWAREVGVTAHVASHTLRKTWARAQHDRFGTSTATLMVALNHSSERQVLTYIGITGEDVAQAYEHVV